MAEFVKKKPPPPRPLKRSSLSGNQTLRTDGKLSFEGTELSGYGELDQSYRRNDSVLEVGNNMESKHLVVLVY
jgi:hypothetical protein